MLELRANEGSTQKPQLHTGPRRGSSQERKANLKAKKRRQGAAFAQGLAQQLLYETPARLSSPHSYL